MSAPCNKFAPLQIVLSSMVSLLCMLGISATQAAAKVKTPEVSAPVVLQPAPVVPAEAQSLFDEALRALQAGQPEQASLALQEVATKYPTYASPLINLGLLEQKANRHESAITYFKRALERDAKSAQANVGMGLSYRHLGKFKDAETAYHAAIAADASYAPAHLNLGILHDLYLQQAAPALQEYETYQSLLATPDTKVAMWIKDLKGRLGSALIKDNTSNAGGQP